MNYSDEYPPDDDIRTIIAVLREQIRVLERLMRYPPSRPREDDDDYGDCA
jgi:hypothetical protein